MYNVNFKTIEECKKMNEVTEAEICNHLRNFFKNQNYRSDYNKRKNALTRLLANDPVVQERMKAISK